MLERLKTALTTEERAINTTTTAHNHWHYLNNSGLFNAAFLEIFGHPVAEGVLKNYLDTDRGEQPFISTTELKKIIIDIIRQAKPLQKLNILLHLPKHIGLSTNQYTDEKIYDAFARGEDSKEDKKYRRKVALDIFAIAYLGLWELEEAKPQLNCSPFFEYERAVVFEEDSDPTNYTDLSEIFKENPIQPLDLYPYEKE